MFFLFTRIIYGYAVIEGEKVIAPFLEPEKVISVTPDNLIRAELFSMSELNTISITRKEDREFKLILTLAGVRLCHNHDNLIGPCQNNSLSTSWYFQPETAFNKTFYRIKSTYRRFGIISEPCLSFDMNTNILSMKRCESDGQDQIFEIRNSGDMPVMPSTKLNTLFDDDFGKYFGTETSDEMLTKLQNDIPNFFMHNQHKNFQNNENAEEDSSLKEIQEIESIIRPAHSTHTQASSNLSAMRALETLEHLKQHEPAEEDPALKALHDIQSLIVESKEKHSKSHEEEKEPLNVFVIQDKDKEQKIIDALKSKKEEEEELSPCELARRQMPVVNIVINDETEETPCAKAAREKALKDKVTVNFPQLEEEIKEKKEKFECPLSKRARRSIQEGIRVADPVKHKELDLLQYPPTQIEEKVCVPVVKTIPNPALAGPMPIPVTHAPMNPSPVPQNQPTTPPVFAKFAKPLDHPAPSAPYPSCGCAA